MRNTGKLEGIELRVLQVCEALLFWLEMKRPLREHEPFNCKIRNCLGPAYSNTKPQLFSKMLLIAS